MQINEIMNSTSKQRQKATKMNTIELTKEMKAGLVRNHSNAKENLNDLLRQQKLLNALIEKSMKDCQQTADLAESFGLPVYYNADEMKAL